MQGVAQRNGFWRERSHAVVEQAQHIGDLGAVAEAAHADVEEPRRTGGGTHGQHLGDVPALEAVLENLRLNRLPPHSSQTVATPAIIARSV